MLRLDNFSLGNICIFMKNGKKNFIRSFLQIRMSYRIISFLIIIYTYGCINPEKKEEPSSDKDPLLRVGLNISVPHLLSLEKDGEPAGMEIELLNLFAKEEGYLLETTVYDKAELFFALRRGEIDIAVPCNTGTYISANFLSPCAPHFQTGRRILVKDSVSMFIKDPAQLNNEDVIVLTVAGTVSSDFSKKLFPESELISLKDTESCLERLQKEDGAIFLTDPIQAWTIKTSGYYINISEKKKKKIKFIPVLPPMTDEQICWAVRRSNKEWKQYLDKFMAEQKKNGTLKKLKEKYCLDAINR
jgi:ABC-type amino acid transport substrate-binding protein